MGIREIVFRAAIHTIEIRYWWNTAPYKEMRRLSLSLLKEGLPP